MSGNSGRGIVTHRRSVPLKGPLRPWVDSKVARLRNSGPKWQYEIYLKLQQTGIVNIAILRAHIVTSPSFLAPRVVTVSRGAPVSPLTRKGSWIKVAYRGHVGWLNKAQLFPHQPIRLRPDAGGSGGSASREEVELSGRG